MVALLRGGRRPWVEYAEMVEEQGSAVAVLEREQTTEADGQTTLIPEDPDPDPDPATSEEPIAQAIADLERWDAQGMRLLTILDPDYPPNLKAVHDRPPIVFVAGHITPQDAHSVAVVGARKATGHGTNQARRIAEHLVHAGYTVISGLAAGIDTAAHTAALSARRPHASRSSGPASPRLPLAKPGLQRRIAQECAVVSQFWPDAPPTRRSFPMRNATMSGIALGHGRGRGVRHERRARRRPASPSRTDGRCSCTTRWSSASPGPATTRADPARTWSASRPRSPPPSSVSTLPGLDSSRRHQPMPTVAELSALYENFCSARGGGPTCAGPASTSRRVRAVLGLRPRPTSARRGRPDLLQRRPRAASPRPGELQAT